MRAHILMCTRAHGGLYTRAARYPYRKRCGFESIRRPTWPPYDGRVLSRRPLGPLKEPCRSHPKVILTGGRKCAIPIPNPPTCACMSF